MIGFSGVGGHADYGSFRIPPFRTEVPSGLQTVHAGHADIHEYEIVAVLGSACDTLQPIVSIVDLASDVGKHAGQDQCMDRMVFAEAASDSGFAQRSAPIFLRKSMRSSPRTGSF